MREQEVLEAEGLTGLDAQLLQQFLRPVVQDRDKAKARRTAHAPRLLDFQWRTARVGTRLAVIQTRGACIRTCWAP